MIGDGNVFVAARDCRLGHRPNIARAITPMRMHLQITAKARTPRWGSGEPRSAFRQRKKFLPQSRWTRWMLFPSDPLPDLFLQKRAHMRELGQRSFLCDQIAGFDFPQKCTSGRATKRALQNI